MKNLRAATRHILRRVEDVSGKSIQFMRDDKLSILATLQMARNGAEFHVLRYQPTDEPLDYLIAHQAGFLLRLFENPADRRFDFVASSDAGSKVEPLVAAGLPLGHSDKTVVSEFSGFVAQWALMNLRSVPIGMRVDQWIALEYPELMDLQHTSVTLQQQQNVNLLSFRRGKLTIPTTLMGSIAAYALFADRLTGQNTFAIPYGAVGLLTQGEQLMSIWDDVPKDSRHDCELVDRWAECEGLTGWYNWTPYAP